MESTTKIASAATSVQYFRLYVIIMATSQELLGSSSGIHGAPVYLPFTLEVGPLIELGVWGVL